MLLRIFASAISAAFVLGVGVGVSHASRNPTDAEKRGIVHVLDVKGQNCDIYPAGSCRVRIKVSSENQSWAAAYILPTPGHEGTVQGDIVSLVRKHHRWRVHQVGNGGGCDVPSPVVRDLHLFCA
jgi:uncharacterized membrane protein